MSAVAQSGLMFDARQSRLSDKFADLACSQSLPGTCTGPNNGPPFEAPSLLAQLLRRRTFYSIDAEFRVLFADLGGLLKSGGIKCRLCLLKALKGEQDNTLRWLAFDRCGPAPARKIPGAIIQKRF